MTPERFADGPPADDAPLEPVDGGQSSADEADLERVRRLLTASGGPDPTPPEVTQRLDEVLAGLVAERAAAEDPDSAPVTSLSEHRSRRWPGVLVAAAAVSVVALGVGTVMQNDPGSSSAGSDSMAQEGDAGSALESQPDPPTAQGDDAGPDSAASKESARDQTSNEAFARGLAKVLPQVRTATLTADAQRVADRIAPASDSAVLQRFSNRCLPANASGGFEAGTEVVAVRLDGQPATMLIAPTDSGERDVRFWSCDQRGSGSILASTTIKPRQH